MISKWDLVILRNVSNQPSSSVELATIIENVSTSTIFKALIKLENLKLLYFVKKTLAPTKHTVKIYSISPYGKFLLKAFPLFKKQAARK